MRQTKIISSQRVRRALRKYQREGLYYAGKQQNPALLWEMRLGKSLTVLRSLAVRFPASGRKLIIAPYSALYQWTLEFKAEGMTDSDYIFLTGTRKQRAKNLQIDTQFYLLNKEGWASVPQIANVNWQAVILDESTFIKNPKAKVSRFFCDNFRDVDSRWILTGMPAPESDLDYFQQLKFLDPSILGFKNFYDFRREFFVQTFQGKYSPTIEGGNYLNTRLAKYCSFLTREDVDLDVEKIFTKRNIKMRTSAWKTMQTLLREYILEVNEKLYSVTDNAGAKFIQARRICGGFVGDDLLFKEKMNVLLDLLKSELTHKQVIIYSEFINEIKTIHQILRKENITSDFIFGGNRANRFDILDNFRKGDIRVLVGQPTCFKHGVDLSCSDTIIYYSMPMSNETFGQSQDRIVNVSQRFTAHIICLICEWTIEEDIYIAMINKESTEKLRKRLVKRIQESIK